MNSLGHTETFRIDQPAETLFPLFSAEGEKLWVPGWDYENISGSDGMHEDFVFLTKSHGHASTDGDTIWLVKRYDPESFFVQFYRVEPDQKVGLITVRCDQVDKGMTDVEVTYEYTALSESGRKFLEHFSEDHYKEFINGWKTHLLHYFQSKQ
ncbi:MAG: hypothetical protein WBB69_04095 [Anaerolineales bacterium]